MKKIIVGITGASGSIFAHRIIESLLSLGHEVHLVVSSNGEKVCAYELNQSFETLINHYKSLTANESTGHSKCFVYDNADLFSQIASGSYKTDAMVVVPCSMGTLSKISQGLSESLLTRAADVMIKEQRKLVLVTRESPLSPIHLENMLKLSRLGVVIMPPVPAFYNKPQTLAESVDMSVGRILELLNVENPHHKIWRNENEI
ncbi:UbiX family flavin prenyltransferase [Fusibacter ferrireducens]|uniref:Flavin prenyltransferase UbiX n=1 Tax=Fusibacter ferrireducens TaxID=2785058 RepID=A0ABR9ZN52_9FIRM|nr:flavin prenyltransferase UbiX [Fusibacter ferrireducens]MBF4691900.1 UbiX family flavin prenyltransferase [Fusibacter ferrireducens]